jgi:aerobic-type carbon monoxide dehydrogenase small subunit (CoxS/CutS family)
VTETLEPIETLHTLPVSIGVNGQSWSGEIPVEEVLLDFLRVRLGLTGSKRSCNSEVCGACTVLVDGRPVSSCNYLAFEADGREVTTVEGLARDGRLDPIQEAFISQVAAQCGFCTSGQLMATRALLDENPRPTYEEMTEWLSGNICRCGTYPAIARAIAQVTQASDPATQEREQQ